MLRRVAIVAVLLLGGLGYLEVASGQTALRPGGPLTCHKDVCAVPGPCEVRESESCLKGGGPPRCPGLLAAPNGTSCNDGNVCTTGDVCTAGVCGGAPVTCSSSSDTCEASTGCATTCGPGGCVVSATGTGNPTLTIPAGALGTAVRVSMTDLGSDPGDPSVFHEYRFGPTGTTFSTPATVDLPAPPLAAGQVPVIEVSDDGVTWVAVATTLSNGRVSGPISHFSF